MGNAPHARWFEWSKLGGAYGQVLGVRGLHRRQFDSQDGRCNLMKLTVHGPRRHTPTHGSAATMNGSPPPFAATWYDCHWASPGACGGWDCRHGWGIGACALEFRRVPGDHNDQGTGIAEFQTSYPAWISVLDTGFVGDLPVRNNIAVSLSNFQLCRTFLPIGVRSGASSTHVVGLGHFNCSRAGVTVNRINKFSATCRAFRWYTRGAAQRPSFRLGAPGFRRRAPATGGRLGRHRPRRVADPTTALPDGAKAPPGFH